MWKARATQSKGIQCEGLIGMVGKLSLHLSPLQNKHSIVTLSLQEAPSSTFLQVAPAKLPQDP